MSSTCEPLSSFDLLPDELIDYLVNLIDSESSIQNRTLDLHPNLKTLSLLSRASPIFHSKCMPILLNTIRLPFTYTPIGSPTPLLLSARDSAAIKLARTLRQNQRLASMVREVEITSRWFPDDGMERCREAYEDILNASIEACGIAFFVGRGEYNAVLGSIKGSYPNLACLAIGVENLERDLQNPLLRPRLHPKLINSNSNFSASASGPGSDPDCEAQSPSSPKLQLMTSYACPMLSHLHLQLPSYIKLSEKCSLILSSLPPTIQHLDISLLTSPAQLCEDLNGESDLSVDFGPGRKIYQIVASLFRTRFVRKSTTHPSGEDGNAENAHESRGGKLELRLSSLTLRFSNGIQPQESIQRAVDQLKSREDLASYLPTVIPDPSQLDQDPFIQPKSRPNQEIKYKQPEQLLRLVLPPPIQVTNPSGELEPWLPPVSRASDGEELLLWRSALNDESRKELIREKKRELMDRRKDEVL